MFTCIVVLVVVCATVLPLDQHSKVETMNKSSDANASAVAGGGSSSSTEGPSTVPPSESFNVTQFPLDESTPSPTMQEFPTSSPMIFPTAAPTRKPSPLIRPHITESPTTAPVDDDGGGASDPHHPKKNPHEDRRRRRAVRKGV